MIEIINNDSMIVEAAAEFSRSHIFSPMQRAVYLDLAVARDGMVLYCGEIFAHLPTPDYQCAECDAEREGD